MKDLLYKDISKYEEMRERAVSAGDEYAVTVIDIQISRIRAIIEDRKEEELFYTRQLWTIQEIGRPKEKTNKT